jgi:hypothetical protein
MAQDLLSTQNLPAEVRVVVRTSDQDQDIPLTNPISDQQNYLLSNSADYTKWKLTNDHTLNGNLKSQRQSKLPHKINATNIDNWDSHGIGLISPVFSLAKQQSALTTLNKYLSTLLVSSDSDISALTSIWAGIHVHLGFNARTAAEDTPWPSRTTFPLHHCRLFRTGLWGRVLRV